jgi:hypothetical protein
MHKTPQPVATGSRLSRGGDWLLGFLQLFQTGDHVDVFSIAIAGRQE